MLTTQTKDQALYLLTPDEIVSPKDWTGISERLLPRFLLTLWWIENFLARPNPDLGRAGPVCPFIRPSLDKRSLWLTAVEGAEPELESFERTVLGYKDWFLELPPKTGDDEIFKSILILLPDVEEQNYENLIDGMQKRLKPAFLKQELMIGQFHPLSEEAGVRNVLFRPLKCPVPLLAIRRITPGDLVFMKGPDGHYNKTFLENFLRTFAKGLPSTFISEITNVMARDNEDAKK
jgi:hypothetical protein